MPAEARGLLGSVSTFTLCCSNSVSNPNPPVFIICDCGKSHSVLGSVIGTGKVIVRPSRAPHCTGWKVLRIPEDGDCFYRAVLRADTRDGGEPRNSIGERIRQLRRMYAESVNEDSLDVWQSQEDADAAEEGRRRRVLTLEQVRERVMDRNWADENACWAVACSLRLVILHVADAKGDGSVFLEDEGAWGTWAAPADATGLVVLRFINNDHYESCELEGRTLWTREEMFNTHSGRAIRFLWSSHGNWKNWGDGEPMPERLRGLAAFGIQ